VHLTLLRNYDALSPLSTGRIGVSFIILELDRDLRSVDDKRDFLALSLTSLGTRLANPVSHSNSFNRALLESILA